MPDEFCAVPVMVELEPNAQTACAVRLEVMEVESKFSEKVEAASKAVPKLDNTAVVRTSSLTGKENIGERLLVTTALSHSPAC